MSPMIKLEETRRSEITNKSGAEGIHRCVMSSNSIQLPLLTRWTVGLLWIACIAAVSSEAGCSVYSNYTPSIEVGRWRDLLASIPRPNTSEAFVSTPVDAALSWSTNCSTCPLFVHDTYLVAYMQSVGSTSTDFMAVEIWPVCPYQYLPPINFVASADALPPICVQGTALITVRPYVLTWVKDRLVELQRNGEKLFDYCGGTAGSPNNVTSSAPVAHDGG